MYCCPRRALTHLPAAYVQGATWAVVRNGKTAFVDAWGTGTSASMTDPIQPGTLFMAGSTTKVRLRHPRLPAR